MKKLDKFQTNCYSIKGFKECWESVFHCGYRCGSEQMRNRRAEETWSLEQEVCGSSGWEKHFVINTNLFF